MFSPSVTAASFTGLSLSPARAGVISGTCTVATTGTTRVKTNLGLPMLGASNGLAVIGVFDTQADANGAPASVGTNSG
ncbi:MAG: hypothetical protein ABR520_12405 [Mycobacteriales bacterium]|nr:hypothetical protein [Frankia sp.]